MKTASLLAALETGKVKLSDEVDTEEGIHAFNNDIIIRDHNWHRGGYGLITVSKAFEMSSNIGICKAVDKAFGKNQQQFFDLLDKMSYGQPDSIEGIVGLKPTIYTSPKDSNWVSSDLWWSAIGYDRKIAPIQMLTFYNAIANGGKMVKPTLKTGVVEIINPQIASKASIDSMQVALERVVSQGLGRRAGTKMLLVAGKTGTAEVEEYYYGENSVSEYQLAFCGYFPADKPKYSMIVSINKIGLPASGGLMAGQVFHNIVEWMAVHNFIKGIKPGRR
jgi:cell division protein FtsI (penicillin-binding protein 3)